MINSKGKCSYEENTRKHFEMFDKEIAKEFLQEESDPIKLTPSQEITFPEDRKRRFPLGTTTMNYVLYENCCISYDEYINRKANEVQP